MLVRMVLAATWNFEGIAADTDLKDGLDAR